MEGEGGDAEECVRMRRMLGFDQRIRERKRKREMRFVEETEIERNEIECVYHFSYQ